MEKNNFLIIFLMLLSLSHLLYAFAIPVTITKNLNGAVTSFIPSLAKLESGEDINEKLMARRIDLVFQDYEEPGPNKCHGPKIPGRPNIPGCPKTPEYPLINLVTVKEI